MLVAKLPISYATANWLYNTWILLFVYIFSKGAKCGKKIYIFMCKREKVNYACQHFFLMFTEEPIGIDQHQVLGCCPGSVWQKPFSADNQRQKLWPWSSFISVQNGCFHSGSMKTAGVITVWDLLLSGHVEESFQLLAFVIGQKVPYFIM